MVMPIRGYSYPHDGLVYPQRANPVSRASAVGVAASYYSRHKSGAWLRAQTRRHTPSVQARPNGSRRKTVAR
jgi:hypothetical protein